MSEQKDYNNYTFEDHVMLEIASGTYGQVLQALDSIHRLYEEDFPNSRKDRLMREVMKRVGQVRVNDKTVEMSAMIFNFCKEKLRQILQKEMVYTADIKIDKVNKKTSRVVKNIPKGKEDQYERVFSPERTAEANLSEQITATGQTVLRIVSALDSIHIANVDAGKGITLEELAEKKKQEEMKTV